MRQPVATQDFAANPFVFLSATEAQVLQLVLCSKSHQDALQDGCVCLQSIHCCS